MSLEELRTQIDGIDEKMLELSRYLLDKAGEEERKS